MILCNIARLNTSVRKTLTQMLISDPLLATTDAVCKMPTVAGPAGHSDVPVNVAAETIPCAVVPNIPMLVIVYVLNPDIGVV